MNENNFCYFLGESTGRGFVTSFSTQIANDGFFTYILKGGPGTGKSSLMKRLVAEFEEQESIDVYYCSSDPSSLDAIVFKNSKIIVVDGTSPHIFDADYPGVSQQIVNLGECWDKTILKKNTAAIKDTIDENQAFHKRCRRYLSALSSLNSDIINIATTAIDSKKIQGFLTRISKKLLPKIKSSQKNNSIVFRKLSAITPDGYIFKMPKNISKIIMLKDDFFAGSDFLLRGLADIALDNGYNVVVNECNQLQDFSYEHLLLPDLDLAFITSNFFNKIQIPETNASIINFARFYKKEVLSAKKQRLDFNKKVVTELKNEAIYSLASAKKTHDKLESFYISSMDFGKIDSITQKLIVEIAGV